MDSQELKSKLWEALIKKKDERLPWGKKEEEPAPYSKGGDGGEGTTSLPDSRPIEPEGSKAGGIARLKWLFFALALAYVLISAYHVPILTGIGRYLVVDHGSAKSDLIVCMAGDNVERGLTAADLYQRGLASKIFVAREIVPDGYDTLGRRGVSYPESRDLMLRMLKGLGVPGSAILTSETPSESTAMEAEIAAEVVKENKFQSILVVTSPTHTRRAWLAFRKAMEKSGVRVRVIPASYSGFKAEEWWKSREYAKDVLLEYQKLVYYFFRDYM